MRIHGGAALDIIAFVLLIADVAHDEPIPIARPRWWLLREGWQRGGGKLSTRTVPG